MKKILLQGPIFKGLYKVFYVTNATREHTPDVTSSFASLATSTIWHDCLTHVYDPIVHKTLAKNNINVIKPSLGFVFE